jgi:hypothetical protein
LKKLLVILLLMVYGLSSTGMTINFHYCCGKLKKVEFSSAQLDCGMKMKHSSGKKCCDNKQVDLKVKDHQKVSESSKTFSNAVFFANTFTDFTFSQPLEDKHSIPSVFAPPPLSNSLYILHCAYRI